MIVVMGGEKGGTGKSTIAENLAVQRTLGGKRVMLIEGDPQKTAIKWATRRIANKVHPHVRVQMQLGGTLAAEVRAMAGDYDDIIIDTRGADSDELRAAMLVANILVSPGEPSQNDLETFEDVEKVIQQALSFNPKLISLVLTNKASTNHMSREADEMRDFCADLKHMKVMKRMMRTRKAYRDASLLGMGVAEIPRDELVEKAVFEMKMIEKEIWSYDPAALATVNIAAAAIETAKRTLSTLKEKAL